MIYIISDAVKMASELNQVPENAMQSELLSTGQFKLLPELSPRLLSFSSGKAVSMGYLSRAWGNAWGIFFATEASFKDCLKHFERLLTVKASTNELLLFRYYDPRVLRTFLPACNAIQLKTFFGPVKVFTVEDKDPAFAISFWLQNHELCSSRIPAADFFARVSPGGSLEKPVV